jgi:hypothetical protein
MKKKTFYVILAIWCVALATLVGVLVNHFLSKDDDTTIQPPPSPEEPAGPDDVPADDDENWTGNY